MFTLLQDLLREGWVTVDIDTREFYVNDHSRCRKVVGHAVHLWERRRDADETRSNIATEG